MNDDTLRKMFEKKKRLAYEAAELTRAMDREIEKRWGFSYSDTDDDQLIDALDYATDDISYSNFIRKMDEYKENYEENGNFGTVY